MSEIKQENQDSLKSNATQSREIVSNAKLLEAGVYFGHKKAKWNPKMKPYIIATKKGTHIIDIQKTKKTLEFAYSIIQKFAQRDAQFIFVGTRKQAQATIKENALRTNSFYVSERWLGGTLTNSKTIYKSVKRMFDLENLSKNNFEGYTKKEGVLFSKELAKLHRNLLGIAKMVSKPQVMIVADPKNDEIAVKEARKLGIKVIGIVDTNCDPNIVDIAIPANDDSIKSVTLIITILADAIVSTKNGRQLFAFQPESSIILPEEIKSESSPRDSRFKRNDNQRMFNNLKKGNNFSNEKKFSKNNGETLVISSHVEKENDNDNVEKKIVETKKEDKVIDEKKIIVNEDYSLMTVATLRDLAKKKNIKGYSTMKKEELILVLK